MKRLKLPSVYKECSSGCCRGSEVKLRSETSLVEDQICILH